MITKHKLEITLPSDTEILMIRSFNAPKALVWEFFTDPEKVRLWLGCNGTMTVSEADFRVGGTWRNVFDAGEAGIHPTRGEFLEIVPTDRIVRTFIYDVPPINEHTITEYADFTESNGVTTVKILVKYPSREVRDGHVQSGVEFGAGMSYDRLDEVLSAV